MRSILILALASVAFAADLGPDLLNAAKKGQTDRVRTLLGQGANVESADKDRRTPLMLAAQHGHADTVRLLLESGAKPEARDRQGWTAYGLALFSSAGQNDEVLHALPHPARLRLAVSPRLAADNLYSSCSLTPRELAQQVQEIHLDALVFATLRDYAAASGKGAAEVVAADAPADAVVEVRVRPSVSCVQQSGDSLSLAIDVRVMRQQDKGPLYEKTFGGGLKGLHARRATSPAQYAGFFEEWVKGHTDEIYWAVLGALLRA